MLRNKPLLPNRVPVKQAKPSKGPRTVSCKNRSCRKRFVPDPPWLRCCCHDCGVAIAIEVTEKRKAARAKVERAETKKKLAAMKSIPTLKAEAQLVFNQYVRLRDIAAGHGCICCGKFATASALAQPGGAYDACHFKSRGSADHLRYNENNCHLGLKVCNTWGHVDYRGGLIQRIGLEAVEALECDQTVVKWTREMLIEIKSTYAAKVRAAKKEMS